ELLESRSSRKRSPRCSPDRSELLRAKDAPENVLEERTGLVRIRGVGERVLEELAFPVARRTSERDAVELGDDRKRLATFAKRAGESAIGILDAAVENLAVQEVELYRETARRRGPAAAARARTAEELERARRDRSVEHIDRARPGGHPGKGLAHARHGADRVEERFGLEGTRREAGEEARL